MAIAFDVGGKSTVQAAISNFSFSGPTVGTLTNGCAVITTQVRGSSSNTNLPITGVTYAGNAANVAKAQQANDPGGSAGSLAAEIWRRLAPGSGSQTVAITFTGTVNHATAYVAALSGVDQTNPVGNTAGSGDAANASPTSTITQNITASANNIMLVDSIYHKIGTSLTRGASQTLIASESLPNGGGDTSDSSYKPVATAGATSMSWTLSGNDGWVIAAAEFKPYVAPSSRRIFVVS